MLKEQIRQVQGLFYPPYRKQSLTTNLFSLGIVDAYDILMMIISSYWKKHWWHIMLNIAMIYAAGAYVTLLHQTNNNSHSHDRELNIHRRKTIFSISRISVEIHYHIQYILMGNATSHCIALARLKLDTAPHKSVNRVCGGGGLTRLYTDNMICGYYELWY